MDIVRAWKSPRYRDEMAEKGADVPTHPSGSASVRMLKNDELEAVAGGAATGAKCLVTALGTLWCAATYLSGC